MDYNYEDTVIDKKRIIENSISMFIAIIFATVVIAGGYLIYQNRIDNSSHTADGDKISQQDLSRIEEAINRIKSEYIDDLDMETLVEGAISGAASSTGDKYTRYIKDEGYEQIAAVSAPKRLGLGIHLSLDIETGYMGVIGVYENCPAQKAGLEIGDRIIKVEDVDVTYENYDAAFEKLKSDEEKTITVKVQKVDGSIVDCNLTFEEITDTNVDYRIIDGNIGYIHIYDFEVQSYVNFRRAYEGLLNKGITSLIVDVRNNLGGKLTEVVSTVRTIAPEGNIVRLVYKDGTEKTYDCDGAKKIEIPLVVLTNERSASAAEIFAGAIKDSGCGTLIGKTTFGKGIVQTVYKLSNGAGAISITTAKYYTASGVEIHKNGITPNIEVELPENYQGAYFIPLDKDTQLNAAIQNLKENTK